MTYSEYRSKAIQWLWKKYDILGVASLPTYSRFRIDDICANHWKAGDPYINAVLALETYLVKELNVVRV